MANGLRFIGANPVAAGQQQFEARRGQRLANAASDFDLRRRESDAARVAEQDQIFSDEINRVRAPAATTSPAVAPQGQPSAAPRNVAFTPAAPSAPAPTKAPLRSRIATGLARAGQGRAAFDLVQGQEATEQAQFDKMVTALSGGNVELAFALAQRNGMRLTPAMQIAFQNTWFQREYALAWERNKQIFGNDPRKLIKAMAAVTASLLGRAQAHGGRAVPASTGGFDASGRPTPSAPTPKGTPQFITGADGTVMVVLPGSTTAAQVTDATGQPVRGNVGSRAADREPANIQSARIVAQWLARRQGLPGPAAEHFLQALELGRQAKRDPLTRARVVAQFAEIFMPNKDYVNERDLPALQSRAIQRAERLLERLVPVAGIADTGRDTGFDAILPPGHSGGQPGLGADPLGLFTTQ